MSRTIAVHLGNLEVPIGTLRYDRDGRRELAAFSYTNDWLSYTDRFAVDPALPLVSGFQFHVRRETGSLFHGAIADTEPDGWGRRVILRAHAKRRQAARLAGEPPSIRVHGHRAQADIEELYRRVAFGIAINNVDDHLHNHGFLHVAHGQWRLCPAFDVNPFPDRVRELKTWIAEDTGPEASQEALLAAAPYFRLSADQASGIIAGVETVVATWRKVGAELGMSAAELDAFADAFA